MTVIEFLEARIAEDEALALGASEGRFSWASVDYNAANCEAHGYRWSPTRVIAECAAKWAIIAEHPRDDDGFCYDSITHMRGCKWEWPCPTIRALAAIYKDHPDYRLEAWG